MGVPQIQKFCTAVNMLMLTRFCHILAHSIVRLYRWKLSIIRRYPTVSAYVAFLEGVCLGIIIYHYFFQQRFSCCIEFGAH